MFCKINLVFVAALFFSPFCFGASIFDEFEKLHAGIMGDIIKIDSSIFIASENGLVRIDDSVTLINSENSRLPGQFISDIKAIDNNVLLLTFYGLGVYQYRVDNGEVSKINIPNDYDEQLIKRTKYHSGNYVFLTSNELFFLTQNGDYFSSKLFFNEDDFVYRDVEFVDGNNIVASLGDKGLIVINLQERSTRHVSSDEGDTLFTFSSLDKVDERIYIGGYRRGASSYSGMGAYLLIDDQLSYVARCDTQHDEPLQPFHKFKMGSDGILRAAAETLYYYNASYQCFDTAEALTPTLQADKLGAISDFVEDDKGTLYVTSSQRGLSLYPSVSPSVSYVMENNKILSEYLSDVYWVTQRNAVVLSTSSLLLLDAEDGIVAKTSVANLSSYYLLPYQNQLLLVSYLNAPVFVIDFTHDTLSLRMLDEPIVKPNNIALRDWDVDILEPHITHDIFDDASQVSLSSQWGHYFSVDGDGVYSLDSDGTIQREMDLDYAKTLRFQCLKNIAHHQILICTSGKGLLLKDTRSGIVRKFDKLPTEFIRDAEMLDERFALTATNRGLFVVDIVSGDVLHIGREFGVKDVDFDYQGIYAGEHSWIVVGDQYNYVINKLLFNKHLQRHLSQLYPVKVNNVVLPNKQGLPTGTDQKGIIDRSTDTLTLQWSERNFSLGFSVDASPLKETVDLEYRLVGLSDEWIRLTGRSHALPFFSLNPGRYLFEARVVEPLSTHAQPITQLNIDIHPPFWRTTVAYLLYLLFFLGIGYRLYRYHDAKLKANEGKFRDVVIAKQDALEESDTLIRRLIERRYQLFSNLAHEFKTPLMLVVEPLTNLVSDPDNPTLRAELPMIIRNARHMQWLLEQLLSIEKITADTQQRTKLYQVIYELRYIVSALNQKDTVTQQLQLISEIDETEIALQEGTLETIAKNSILHFIEQADPDSLISVTVRKVGLDIEIKVHGACSSELSAQSITSHSVVNEETRQPSDGASVEVIKQAVLVNNGWLLSEPDGEGGNALIIRLPLIDLESQSVSSNINESGESYQLDSETALALKPKSSKPVVLIVDENDDMRGYLSRLLGEEYQCMKSANRDIAIRSMEVVLPDLVIADIGPSGYEGVALIKQIRQGWGLDLVPIIIISNRDDSDTMYSVLSVGGDRLMSKPVNPSELLLTVKNLISTRQRLSQVVRSSDFEHATSQALQMTDLDWLKGDKPEFDSEKSQLFYVKFIEVLRQSFQDENFNRKKAASQLAVSERQLNRNLSQLGTLNFSEFLRRYRLYRSCVLLEQEEQVAQVAFNVGFGTPSYFSACFKQEFGQTPSQYQDEYLSRRLNGAS